METVAVEVIEAFGRTLQLTERSDGSVLVHEVIFHSPDVPDIEEAGRHMDAVRELAEEAARSPLAEDAARALPHEDAEATLICPRCLTEKPVGYFNGRDICGLCWTLEQRGKEPLEATREL